jgi:DNA (cytosine-5)-methyltransferase 1
MREIKVGSDFSGVGAFDYAIGRVAEAKAFNVNTIYSCDWDKYARISYVENHGEPPYYPRDVYEREIPEDSLDIYMTSPPCQAFSLAGKRLGKEDKRGILFFNSHEFIQKNKPRFFIFENVKGLLSDDGGKTFSEWINMLGGKSVNGLPVLFPYEDSVPYHVYWKVLNTKEHGVPQNRERVFIIGIRDDQDNDFRFPVEEPLTRRLKDILEDSVDDKYFLRDATIEKLIQYDAKQKEKGNGFGAKFHDVNGTMSALKVGGGSCDDLIKIKSATQRGYEIAKEGDSINFSVPNSETRRGRVGKEVAQTLDTQCNQGVMVGDYRTDEGFRWRKDGNSPAIMAMMRDTWKDNFTGQNPPIINKDYKIRRLTPRECFRLQDFPDSFKFVVSDSQLYKQAGNSITVRVLEKILLNLPL